MGDAHVVDFADPHPDRARGCWAARAGSACNREDVDDAGLCPDHGAAYRQHPSSQEPPAAPEPSWLSRVVDDQLAREHAAGLEHTWTVIDWDIELDLELEPRWTVIDEIHTWPADFEQSVRFIRAAADFDDVVVSSTADLGVTADEVRRMRSDLEDLG